MVAAKNDVELGTGIDDEGKIKPVREFREYGRRKIVPNDILLDNWTVVSAFDLVEDHESYVSRGGKSQVCNFL